jgi:hypothetical protein
MFNVAMAIYDILVVNAADFQSAYLNFKISPS